MIRNYKNHNYRLMPRLCELQGMRTLHQLYTSCYRIAESKISAFFILSTNQPDKFCQNFIYIHIN